VSSFYFGFDSCFDLSMRLSVMTFPPFFSHITHRSSSHTHHTNSKSHAKTAPMIDRLLSSLVDELDQTKLGIHSLDV
jgi:hypothetical protein